MKMRKVVLWPNGGTPRLCLATFFPTRCIYIRVELFTHLAPIPKEFRSVTGWVPYTLFKSPQSHLAPLLTREEETIVRRLNRLGALLGVAILVAGGFATAVQAADGSLDSTFDSDGIVITDLGGTDGGNSAVIQADGKIVVAGYSYNNGGRDFALARYNTNGSLDTTFDSDGIAITNLGGTNDIGISVAIQADGKIVVAGESNKNGTYDFVLVRYNADSSLDTTFDGDTGTGNGIVITTQQSVIDFQSAWLTRLATYTQPPSLVDRLQGLPVIR
ncbi:MAG: hypothetical protein FGM45_04435 [Actinobacteria bacterium]|nr:hypothetical protein [Actinomycetota bacterium]